MTSGIYPRSNETRRKISIYQRNKHLSEDTKNKIRIARAKQIIKPHKTETKIKISKSERRTKKKINLLKNTKRFAEILKIEKAFTHIFGKDKSLEENSKSKMSEEQKNKIRSTLLERTKRLGYTHSPETIKKLRLSAFEYAKKVIGILCPRIGHNEKFILDKLENELNCKILRQYPIEGYYLDGYIPSLNLAIEVDEVPKNKQKDINRQKIIENKLNCKFLRVNDFD